MIFKSYIIEKNFSQIETTQSILFYGENNGLKNFLKDLLKIIMNNLKLFLFYKMKF